MSGMQLAQWTVTFNKYEHYEHENCIFLKQ